jgi:hypothetical protein
VGSRSALGVIPMTGHSVNLPNPPNSRVIADSTKKNTLIMVIMVIMVISPPSL